MGARRQDPKTVVVAVRLTPAEAAFVDAQRRSLTRSEWLRWLLVEARKRG